MNDRNDHWSPAGQKTDLTPREVLKIAYAHLILGIEQMPLATQYETNQGRISEAISVVKEACENHREYHADRMARRHLQLGAANYQTKEDE
jgi:hypothetical protein